MMSFPSMLVDAAEKAGMSVPDDPEGGDFAETHPHFHVFCVLQLGRPITWGEHWDNAKVIADIPVEELKVMKLEDFLAKGLKYQT